MITTILLIWLVPAGLFSGHAVLTCENSRVMDRSECIKVQTAIGFTWPLIVGGVAYYGIKKSITGR